MTTISIRLDESEKSELECILAEMGMNLSTFYMLYTKKVLRDRKIPFTIEASLDPFYSRENVSQILKADRQVRDGCVVEKSMKELEDLDQ
ncbi:MAG: type II toxin-antitoxin system RelB/DinJ family antitoxin [Clostridiales bacterium]|nr:type II toxin-antitoxin system RelB/DinJ family antitoxin [Clostridiales bacterium]